MKEEPKLNKLERVFFFLRVLEKYYVGDLISDEFPTFPERG